MQNESFVHRRPVIVGILIGCLLGLPLAGYFGVYRPVTEAHAPTAYLARESQTDLKIKGNKQSKIYHLPECASYDRIAERNIVWFKTHEEAKAAGYRMAKNC